MFDMYEDLVSTPNTITRENNKREGGVNACDPSTFGVEAGELPRFKTNLGYMVRKGHIVLDL